MFIALVCTWKGGRRYTTHSAILFLKPAFTREGQRMENISVKVPDTITSWSAAAYAISSELGIGVANPVDITVVQPFFLTMKLPYSVIRGEILELPVSVFNYVPGCTQVCMNSV